jgi:hypothetical protein
MESKFIQIILLSQLLIMFIAGCNTSDPLRVEEDFGNSVHQMVQGQIYDPNAALFPDPEPPMTSDGIRAGNALESYRKEVGSPQEVEQPVLIDIAR